MPRRRRVTTGVLKGHYKSKNTYYPGITSKIEFDLVDSTASDLPDLLWPVVLVHLRGHAAIKLIRELQDLVISTVPNHIRSNSAAAVDGRLSSLEQFGKDARRAIISALRSSPIPTAVFPRQLAGVLNLFDDPPGTWLAIAPWGHTNVPARDESLDFLMNALGLAMIDDHRNALAKSPAVIWKARIGKLSVSKEQALKIIDYPTNLKVQDHTDAFIRSIFGVLSSHLDQDSTKPTRDAWVNSFWKQNLRLSDCLVESEPSVDGEDARQTSESQKKDPQILEINDPEVQSASNEFSFDLGKLFTSFMDEAVTSQAALDPAEVERFEVVTGLVYRIFRALLVAFKSPYLWNSEHGSGLIRMLFETEISLLWLKAHDSDGSYRKYQSYGKGKGKLHRIHLERLIEHSKGTDY